jgi:hypothetical protein
MKMRYIAKLSKQRSFIMRFSLFFFSAYISLFSLFSHANFTLVKDPLKNIESLDLSALNIADLCQVADGTLDYFKHNSDDHFGVHGGQQLLPFSDLAQVEKTLDFICKTHHQDIQKGQISRLKNNTFLAENFNFYHWQPDKKTANAIAIKSTNVRKAQMLNQIPNEQILLTKYYTKLLDGSKIKTPTFNQALYALPSDEHALTQQQADQKKSELLRFKYTRQQIIEGALDQNALTKPLIWLTEEALHDVLLQGTGVLNVDGVTRYFNVHRNNNIAYDYSLGKREQARYWYFAEVPSIMGYGQSLQSKIAIKPYVTFAGNVKQLGLGQLFLVSDNKQYTQLGIMADQGGAFDNNLFQLDFLVDSYRGWHDYHQANKQSPDYVNAWLLLLK